MAADDTKYSDGKSPDPELKAIFVSESLDQEWRKKLADKKWLTVSLMANLGNGSNNEVEEELRKMFPELKDQPADGDEESTAKYLMMAAVMGVISACKRRAAHQEARREKMLTDESCTPQMGETLRSQARKRYKLSHPDDIIDDSSEPHDKFVDELLKGVNTHPNYVESYSVSKMYLCKEKVEEEHGIVKTLDKVLESVAKHKPKWCKSSEEVIVKINGFFIGLEYVCVCEHSQESGTRIYIAKLREFEDEYKSLEMLIRLDWECRKKIKEYQVRSEKEMSFTEALKIVIKDHFESFVVKVTHKKAIADLQVTSPTKSPQPLGNQPSPGPTPGVNLQQVSNNAIKQEWARRMEEKRGGDKGSKGKGGRGKGGRGKGGRGKGGQGRGSFANRSWQAVKPKFEKFNYADGKSGKNKDGKGNSQKGAIPNREYAAMMALDQKNRCRYWNSSLGCNQGRNCGFKHECMQCGSRQHTLYGFHLNG